MQPTRHSFHGTHHVDFRCVKRYLHQWNTHEQGCCGKYLFPSQSARCNISTTLGKRRGRVHRHRQRIWCVIFNSPFAFTKCHKTWRSARCCSARPSLSRMFGWYQHAIFNAQYPFRALPFHSPPQLQFRRRTGRSQFPANLHRTGRSGLRKE